MLPLLKGGCVIALSFVASTRVFLLLGMGIFDPQRQCDPSRSSRPQGLGCPCASHSLWYSGRYALSFLGELASFEGLTLPP